MESEQFLWVASAVKDLLAVTPTPKFPCGKRRVAQALNFYVDQVTEGNIAELARRLGVPKNTLWLWYNGSNLPTLESLLQICRCLNTSPLDFLTGELQILSQEQLALPPLLECKPKAKARVFDSAYLRDLQQKLQELLSSDKTPPLSMKQTAKQLGHNSRTIYRHFPDLGHQISAKYDDYQNARYLAAIEQACKEVHRVVLELHAESIYPSEARVSERMNKPGYLRYKKVRAVLREAKVAVTS